MVPGRPPLKLKVFPPPNMKVFLGMVLMFTTQLVTKVTAINRLNKSGNVSIGFLVSLHGEYSSAIENCTRFYLPGVNRVEALIYAVDKINNDSELLPNVTLGYDIRDYCNDRGIAMKSAYEFITSNSFTFDSITEYSTNARNFCRQCMNEVRNHSDSIVGVVGPFGSRNSLQVAGLMRVVGLAGISPSATSEELSWPFYDQFFRTVPPDNLQAKAMADLIDEFDWNYVAAVAVEHSYGLYGIRALEREALERKTFCIGFTEYIAPTDYQRNLPIIVERLKRAAHVKVVVLWIEDRIAKDLMKEAAKQKLYYRIWVMSDSLATKNPDFLGSDFIYLGIYLGIQPKQYRDIEYENHLKGLTPKKSLKLENKFWETVWKEEYGCVANLNASNTQGSCSENFTISTIFNKLSDDFVSYQVDAVYAIAHALDKIYRCKKGQGLLKGGECPSTSPSINPHHVLMYLRNVSFKGITGRIQFDELGDPYSSSYDIISFQQNDGVGRHNKVKVGDWFKNRSSKLKIFEGAIAWNSSSGIPKSVCKDVCPPGTMQTTTIACCWECLKCPDGTITQSHGARNCTSCSAMQLSSDDRITCIDLPIISLKWSDITAIVIAIITSIGLLLCAFVMFVFVRYRDTPIVKASNKELSAVILLAIVLCYVLTFLHISGPSDELCSVVEPLRYVSLTICVSVLVLKTIRILRAFETRAMLQCISKNLIFDTRKQFIVVLLINAPQLLLLALWKGTDQPSLKKEIVAKVSILLSCQLYKTTAGFTFHMCMVAYLIMWSLFCAYYAFKARNLPENFNEAKYIGFSMYILLLSWITYFPVQYTLDGWYVTVVSCATILVSSYGFLICIFAPKIHVALFHPERNTSEFVRSTIRQHKSSEVEPARDVAQALSGTIVGASPLGAKITTEA
ncbi:extracellular calcium-sensing receptor-like isoform X2 [Actinia tenebrosa]|uniref:Extracellular calcium-sensing receptor-like isoform X2 n=1 Tax=Actinia tenebrosa TaxID=6105 RepID=A0A6P8HYH6_ACTTE|nr:extracellular calcium-sensing receptor-like isoform X2 [Actinia tenebrosa]